MITLVGCVLRWPLRLIPPGAWLPIVFGPAR